MIKNKTNFEFVYDPMVYERGVPFSSFAKLREEGPIIWIEEKPLDYWPGGDGFWLVVHHETCLEVLKNPDVFSSQLQGTQLRNPTTKEDLSFVQKMMLNMDPPDHTRLRRHLISAFTSKAIRTLETQIAHHAKCILDDVIGKNLWGECDFVKDIASDLPLRCLADIFGIPFEDRYLMYDWANRAIGYQDPDYAQSASFDPNSGTEMAREAFKRRPKPNAQGIMPDPRSRHGMDDLYYYAHLLASYKRENPSEDVISTLLTQLDDEGEKLDIAEFETMFWLFMVAGNETLRNGIPGGMIALLQNPDIWKKLQSQPDLLPGAIAEMLRWWTPVMNFRRTAKIDTRLGGKNISANQKVMTSFISANYDERAFPAPHIFGLNRESNNHLSFGYGPHFCMGAQLAEAQMRAIFSELLERFDSVKMTNEPKFLRSNFQRGVKSLPIRWKLKS